MAQRAIGEGLADARILILEPTGEPALDLLGRPKEIPVKFDPSGYNLSKSMNYKEEPRPGRSKPKTQFGSGNARTLSMELFFDTYFDSVEETVDVREEYTDKIDQLVTIGDETQAPSICRFVWGDALNFTGVLRDADKRFTLFLDSSRGAVPVRARVNITIAEYEPPKRQESRGSSGSANKTKVRSVNEGDTIGTIAAKAFGDPTKWRKIAAANGITNPRTVQPGRDLTIPPQGRK